MALPFLVAFDTSKHSIPLERILSGGPARDGIPAILAPRLLPAAEATFLVGDDRVIGVVVGGAARAYPLKILVWHEIVDDTLGGRDIAVTYCPLTASALVFDRSVAGATFTFGVSGMLYQSNLLMYDHQTESLWSQLGSAAVTGPQTGALLTPLPSMLTTWSAWKSGHPQTTVLSSDTPVTRDYSRDPYAGYAEHPGLRFPVEHLDQRLPSKAHVIGVRVDEDALAVPIASIRDGSYDEDVTVADRIFRFTVDPEDQGIGIQLLDSGGALAGVEAYWFAWAAFHPQTRIDGLPTTAPRGARLPDDRNPEASPPGSAVDTKEVRFLEHRAYWSNLFVPFDEGEANLKNLLIVSGRLRNESAKSLSYSHLRFTLLNESGEPVASQEGYNVSAEDLVQVEGFEDSTTTIAPLAAGAEDRFRMLFLRSETPPFARYRVEVLDSPPAKEEAGPKGPLSAP